MKPGKNGLVIFQYLLLLLAVLAVWWPSFGTFFSLDDHEFLLRASGHEVWPDQFRRPLSTQLYFDAAWALFGDRAWLYHLAQMLLHLGSTAMVALLARRLGMREAGALASAAFFALTPVAFTTLYWISGIQESSMVFFALLAAWLALGKSRGSAWGALAAFLAAILCKESAAPLLPAMAIFLPGDRGRRLRIGLGGLALALLVLGASGSLAPKPEGDPYETALGLNLLWNLLGYLAWLVRPWDFYPDSIPQPQKALWLWGLVLPALLALAAWRRPDWRSSIVRAGLFFLILLLPVLPLIRHSYFYYLYLPLVPLWLLAGEGLARLDRSRRWILVPLLLIFALHSAWAGSERRNLKRPDGMIADPMIRYAEYAETSVNSLRADESPKSGDMLILAPFVKKAGDLAEGLASEENAVRISFMPVERALLGGKALLTFFPELESVRFEEEVPAGDSWRNMNFWWTYGEGTIAPLGPGDFGRHKLARLLFKSNHPNRAASHLEALLEVYPDDANLLHDLGTIVLAQKDLDRLAEILRRLQDLASGEGATDKDRRAFEDLRRLAAAQLGAAP